MTLTMALIIAVIAVGLWIIFQVLRSKNYRGDEQLLEHKNGLPILPRDQRKLTKKEGLATTAPDALSNLAMVAKSTDVASDMTNDTHPKEGVAFDGVFQGRDMDSLSKPKPAMSEIPPSSPAPSPTAQYDSNIRNAPRHFAEPDERFDQSSPLLDKYLGEQDLYDQNNDPLLNATDTVTIAITPRGRMLHGSEILDIVHQYSLKYGVMNMYHRYQHEDGYGYLWFSMLGMDRSGVVAFDLNTLPESYFTGVTLFLSLPHPQAGRGFQSMIATARMIAKDLSADIHDEEGYIIDDNYQEKLRVQVENYQ